MTIGARRRLVVVGCLVLAAVLRFPNLHQQSLWIDEVMSFDSAAQPLAAVVVEPDGLPPLYHLLLKLSGLWSSADDRGRGLSAFFGVCSVALLIVLGTRMFGPDVGLLGGFLLALSPLDVWYSREGRMYALFALTGVLSSLCLVAAVQRGRRRDWAAFGIATLAGLATHYLYAGIALAQGLFVLLDGPTRRRHLRALLAVASAVAVPCLLALPIIALDRAGGWTWRAFDPAAIPYTAFVFVAGFGIGPTLEELHTLAPLAAIGSHRVEVGVVVIVGLLVGAIGLRAALRAGSWGRYVLLWLLVPPAFVVVAAHQTGVAYNARLVLVALPAFVLMVALGIASCRRGLAVSAGVALVAIATLSIARDRLDPRYFREDLRAAGAYLSHEADGGARILVCADYARQGIAHYYRGATVLEALPLAQVETAADAERVVGDLAARPTWVVLTRSWEQDPRGVLRETLERATGGPVARFPGVRIYRLG